MIRLLIYLFSIDFLLVKKEYKKCNKCLNIFPSVNKRVWKKGSLQQQQKWKLTSKILIKCNEAESQKLIKTQSMTHEMILPLYCKTSVEFYVLITPPAL